MLREKSEFRITGDRLSPHKRSHDAPSHPIVFSIVVRERVEECVNRTESEREREKEGGKKNQTGK